ncbi:MAG: argininosuccinate lyase [Syntrophaceae bacterium]|nr:argininosuccinate lyase [Syntrophaceae bacterium]
MAKTGDKPWGGRFKQLTDKDVEIFQASIEFDRRLYHYDIEGSIAHARMLAKQKLITGTDLKLIIRSLKDILHDIDSGTFIFSADDEDIHMAVEKNLIERIGETGGKLHTGRSRNDQIALDMRLYLREQIAVIMKQLAVLKGSFINIAKKEINTIIPGYTHLQRAQPVLLAHYFLAYWEMLDRDYERLKDCLKRVDVMPLGAGALAGTGLPIDRDYTAKLLKFPKVSQNSMDAVSDRDFVAEFIFDAALIQMHLSRFCEDLVLWSSDEFAFVEIADSFTTGSSIMPQKKNPDVAELIRGKTGRIYGNLMGILTVMKGLPMTYNKDLQEDKEGLFDTVDTLKGCLKILCGMVKNITFKRLKMAAAASEGFSMATDVAEYLVMKGVSFRESHGIVGHLVAYCIKKKKEMTDLKIEEFQKFYRGFDDDVYQCLSVENSVNRRNIKGGTAVASVKARIRQIEKI